MSGGPRPWKVGRRGGVLEAHVGRRAGTSTGPMCCRRLPSRHVCVRPPLQVLDSFDFVFIVLFSLRLKIIKIIAYWLELFQNIDNNVCIPKNSLRFL